VNFAAPADAHVSRGGPRRRRPAGGLSRIAALTAVKFFIEERDFARETAYLPIDD